MERLPGGTSIVLIPLCIMLSGFVSTLQQDEAATQWSDLQSLTHQVRSASRQLEPNDPALNRMLAEIISAHRRFLATYPGHAAAWSTLARLSVDARRMDEADLAFEQSYALDPTTGTAVTWATAWMQASPERGIALLDRVIAHAPDDVVLQTNRLRALMLHDDAGIEGRFADLLQAPGGDVEAATMLDALSRMNIERSKTMLPLLAAAAPNSVAVAIAQARVARVDNRFGNARSHMERVPTDQRSDPPRRYLYSDTCYAEHDFQKAFEVMQAIDLESLAVTKPGLHRRLKFLRPLRQQIAALWPAEQETRLEQAAVADNPLALMTIDGQEVFIELFEDSAPNTVAAFIAMVDHGLYDDKPAPFVHVGFRSIFGERADDDPLPRWTLPGEFEHAGQRPHISGGVAMLRNAARPDSAETRFYILHFPAPHLDGHRTIFGRVYSGLDVLRDMRGDERVDSIRILRRRPHAYDAKAITPDGDTVTLRSLLESPAQPTADR